jgi:hypothetical protein
MSEQGRVLTDAQRDRGLSLAERERVTRWDWGDWAVDVAGPVGEDRTNNGAMAKLDGALAELAAYEGSYALACGELPTLRQLLDYRAAASAIPTQLRHAVRSTYIAGKLAGRVPDVRERHALIVRLADEHPDGIVTERALREALGDKSKDGAVAKERDELRERVRELEERLPDLEREPTIDELMGGESIPDFAASWADNLVLRVHGNARDLTALVKREGLRFAPSTPLSEMYDWLLDAERQIAEVRAAVHERMQDQSGVNADA